jgi:hypothetical protein
MSAAEAAALLLLRDLHWGKVDPQQARDLQDPSRYAGRL